MIETAKVINDKWDAVWELPALAFLSLLRYRKARVEYDRRQAAKTAGKTIYG